MVIRYLTYWRDWDECRNKLVNHQLFTPKAMWGAIGSYEGGMDQNITGRAWAQFAPFFLEGWSQPLHCFSLMESHPTIPFQVTAHFRDTHRSWHCPTQTLFPHWVPQLRATCTLWVWEHSFTVLEGTGRGVTVQENRRALNVQRCFSALLLLGELQPGRFWEQAGNNSLLLPDDSSWECTNQLASWGLI